MRGRRVRVFLDTSALFSAIWSERGGGRQILRLGEAGAVQLVVSRRVLQELEGAFRRKAPDLLGLLAHLLDQAGVEVVGDPPEEEVEKFERITGHRGDAVILGGALRGEVDYFVTLDREHFLDNPAVSEAIPFPMGTPGDFLEWMRGVLLRMQTVQEVDNL
ncbi:hypothetical protein DRP77_12170 [Candidatus Poribacteria bacterium]|nr:MAG: hypothetical protein DRP77_12170 [Candidatus Poribacteria bacterium]